MGRRSKSARKRNSAARAGVCSSVSMRKSFRRLVGLGLFGVMLAASVPVFAAPQGGKKGGTKKGGKKGGGKGLPKGGGRGGSQ